MTDFNARHVIEALRSGVPSYAVAEYFSEARPDMVKKIRAPLDMLLAIRRSDGMVFTGRYGEGKTHMLNTVFNWAASYNMVVSSVPLGKETPMDKLYLVYQKVAANTYLPGAAQPGFRSLVDNISRRSSGAADLMAFAGKELDTDKLFYLLQAYRGTQEEDEKELFLGDLEGNFVSNTLIRKSYKRVTGMTAKFNQNFSKTKHTMDYFYFLSNLFRIAGYAGWILLFDEAELLGRLGKKARAKCYREMNRFLHPETRMNGTFSLFAFSASYEEEVIDKRNDEENVASVYADDPESLSAARTTLNDIRNAPELKPLTKGETLKVLMKIQEFHGRAYDWKPDISAETIFNATEAGGYLLRTKIRAAIEFFDQLYQYGEAGKTKINELGEENLEESEAPDLPELDSL